MIFPSLFANVETGMISQMSVYLVLAFSFIINKFRKLLLFAFLLGCTGYFGQKIFALMYVPGGCGTLCMANKNYYGVPWGGNPVYLYPNMPFHSLYGPTPYYFRPYPPSPYRPQDCPVCMLQYQRYTVPYPGINGSTRLTKLHVPYELSE